jgi:L-fuconate dehydratase
VPTDLRGGSYIAPLAPGNGMEMKSTSRAEFAWTGEHRTEGVHV